MAARPGGIAPSSPSRGAPAVLREPRNRTRDAARRQRGRPWAWPGPAGCGGAETLRPRANGAGLHGRRGTAAGRPQARPCLLFGFEHNATLTSRGAPERHGSGASTPTGPAGPRRPSRGGGGPRPPEAPPTRRPACRGGTMPTIEKAFGVPAGHSLRLVRATPCGVAREWEHEERDRDGRLVALYESWSRDAAPPAP